MKRNILFLISLTMLIAAVLSGCGGAPSTPTKAAPTSAPAAITVIVTATIPPPPPTIAVPTLTLIPTAVITATAPITTPGSIRTATPAAGTPRATATRRPATATPTKASAVAPTAVPLKYAAPTPLEPIYGNGRTDSRHYPGESLIFKWTAVAGLAPNECYLVNVAFNPGQADSFLTACGDQTAIGAPVSFVLSKPGFPSPTYASLLPNAGQNITVEWYVTIVRDLGLKPDNVHHNTAPLSPPSNKVQFLLIGS